MAIAGFEIIQVTSDFVTIDLIIWRRYMQRARGLVELMLDANPHLSRLHQSSPFLPVGTLIRVPIDPSMMVGKPPASDMSNLWTDRKGYSL
jgi:phage tail protein X